MPAVVGVLFAEYGRVHYVNTNGIKLTSGDRVLAEVNRELRLGTVVGQPMNRPPDHCRGRLAKVSRRATEEDERQAQSMEKRREKALRVCRQKIEKHGLNMRLVDAQCSLDGSRITFYFSAEERVDFRNLVKDLAAVFRSRIQMEHIGVRDKAARLGGCGCCGRELCCASWLPQFYPVSIRMAKEQWLSLNPDKISGACGRLLCCLRYEYDTYREANKQMPKRGSQVRVNDLSGKVIDVQPLCGRVVVRLESGAREAFSIEEVDFGKPIRRKRAAGGESEAARPSSPREKTKAVSPESDEAPKTRRRRRRRRKKPADQQTQQPAAKKAKATNRPPKAALAKRRRAKAAPDKSSDRPQQTKPTAKEQADGEGKSRRRRRRRRRRSKGGTGSTGGPTPPTKPADG